MGQFWFGSVKTKNFMQPFDAADKARGWVRAFGADTGAVHWRFHAPKPILAAVTPTAGGLVFTADLGSDIYALDAASGKVLWHTQSGQSVGGGIVSYRASGRQRIGVAVGMKSPFWPGTAKRSSIVVYGL